MTNDQALIEKLHEEACQKGASFYVDPQTGNYVFTRKHHQKRGTCCKSGCRHCPYGFKGPKKTK